MHSELSWEFKWLPHMKLVYVKGMVSRFPHMWGANPVLWQKNPTSDMRETKESVKAALNLSHLWRAQHNWRQNDQLTAFTRNSCSYMEEVLFAMQLKVEEDMDGH